MKKAKYTFLIFVLAIAFSFALSGCKGDKSVELSFNSNGGNAISSEKVKTGTDYELPSPTREGFEFAGWYTNSSFEGESVSTYKAAESVTFYAKWIELYKINLDLDGGTLNVSYVYGKEGDSVLSLLEGLSPTKGELTFYGWYNGGDQLGSAIKLTSSGITVTAKYKAGYIVNVYKEKMTKDGYDKETVDGAELVGKSYTAKLTYEGFKEVEKAETVKTITISDNSSNNVLNLYFERETYNIAFRTNYPLDEMQNSRFDVSIQYGEKIDLPKFDMEVEGYYLLGWSESVKGEVLYDAHYIDGLLFNSENEETEVPKISTNKDFTLYAIWNKGNKDMFGGSDYIFVKDSETVVLSRGGVYFLGELYDNNEFMFYVDKGNLEGKIFPDGTFAYLNIGRSEYAATRFVVGEGLKEEEKILLDEYNGITYSHFFDGHNNLSKGTYVIEDDIYYVATFTEGEKAGETLTIILGAVTLDESKVDAFQLRNENEYALGKIVRGAIANGRLTYYTDMYDMTMNGFGTIAYNTPNGKANYYYTYDSENEIITLKNSQGQIMGVLKLMDIDGTLGYLLYNESMDLEFEGADGSVLKTDGVLYGSCTLADGTEIKGFYTAKQSVFGGYVITISDHSKIYTYLTKVIKDDVATEGDEGETTASYTFETKPEGYAEYYYKDDSAYYYAPLIVLNDKEEGKASIYGYTSSKTYELVLEGTYTQDQATGLYVFNKTKLYNKVVSENPVDLSKIKTIVFDCDTTSTQYSINIWYKSTTTDDTTTEYDEKYTSSNGESLTLVAGIGIYSKDDYTVVGQYTTEGSLTTIKGTNLSLYLELDTANKTFITLEFAPYKAYVVTDDRTYDKNVYVEFDGKGGATYHYVEENVTEVDGVEEIETIERTIVSTQKLTGETTFHGEDIMEFKSAELTFRYIVVESNNVTFCFIDYSTFSGEYESAEGTLVLDGFGYYAKYTDNDGNVYEAVYSIVSESTIKMSSDEFTRYFDITSTSFTLKGIEYGTYTLMENQGALNKFVEIDGYGKAKVYTLNGEEKSYETENATYELDGERCIINYTLGATEKTYIGYLGTYKNGNDTLDVFRIEHLELVKTFVNNKDWTIIKLESDGTAYRYGANGETEKGTFTIITDNLFYFSNEDESKANIYKYNMDKGTITESSFTQRGYYTEELRSLLFSQYGFAIFNNDTRYYYALEGNDVIIYRQDPENPNSNDYGFVSENFGEFDDIKEYNGETYYANDGFALSFSRVDDTASKYPLLVNEEKHPLEDLVFTPSGSDTFSVTGSVRINGKNYNCTVRRELVDDAYETYVVISGYRFDIDIKYKGKTEIGESISKYEVLSMTYISGHYPYAYLNTYYYLYSFLGAQYAYTYENNLGMIYIYREYDEDGEIVEDYINLDFLEETQAVDQNGEILKGEHLEYKMIANGQYLVTVPGTDGYDYEIVVVTRVHQAFRLAGYVLYSVNRLESFESNGYKVVVGRTTYSENGIASGNVFSLYLYQGETKLEHTETFQLDGYWYFVTREFDGNTITSTTYYRIKFIDKEEGSVGEENTSFEPYESAEIDRSDVMTYYAENGTDFVDVNGDRITILAYGQYKYIIKDSVYDSESKKYTVTLSSGRKFEVSIDNEGVATITPIVEI